MPTGSVERLRCRQRLSTAWLGQVRLDDEVRERVHGNGGVLIDDEGDEPAGPELTHKVLGAPPVDGIEEENVDLTKERRKAVESSITVRAAVRTMMLGMPTLNITLKGFPLCGRRRHASGAQPIAT